MKNIISDLNELRKISVCIEPLTDVLPIVNELKEILISNHGLGLSAIQIGEPKRIFVFRSVNNIRTFNILVNPVLLEKECKIIFNNEGCLSFPNKFCKTERFNKITVQSNVIKIENDSIIVLETKQIILLTGWLSLIVQHEVDHLDGILMFDREYKQVNIGRNELCSCGSGKKYKKCCLLKNNN